MVNIAPVKCVDIVSGSLLAVAKEAMISIC